MSASFIQVVDPVAGNVKVKTDVIGGEHAQFLKLMDGTIGSTASIPGDATNGLYVNVKDSTVFRSDGIESEGVNQKHAVVGAIRSDSLSLPAGSEDLHFHTMRLDSTLRLYVNATMQTGTLMKAGSAALAVKRANIAQTAGAIRLVTGAANKVVRVIAVYLQFITAADFSVRCTDDGETPIDSDLVGDPSNRLSMAAKQIWQDENVHGLFETTSGTSNKIDLLLSASTKVVGYVLYVEY